MLATLGDAWLLEPDTDLLERLGAYLDAEGIAPADLAAPWAETFLQTVPPYASLFLSEDGMLNSWPADRAAEIYAAAGFLPRPEWRAGAPDNLGVQLHFLAYLLPDRPKRAGLFLREQILPWAPVCCVAVERAGSHRIFRSLARLTLDALRDAALLTGR